MLRLDSTLEIACADPAAPSASQVSSHFRQKPAVKRLGLRPQDKSMWFYQMCILIDIKSELDISILAIMLILKSVLDYPSKLDKKSILP